MTQRDWQTGKGCCLDGIRGQLSLLGPVFNKVPINSPFISDRNQCTSDWVSQLTLSTARGRRKGRRREEKRREGGCGRREEIAKEIRETIAKDEHECLPQVVFSFSCAEKWGHLRSKETGFPRNQRPPGVCGWGHPDRKQRPPISQEEVRMCCVAVAAAQGVSGEAPRSPPPYNPPTHAHHLLELGVSCTGNTAALVFSPLLLNSNEVTGLRGLSARSLSPFLPMRLTATCVCVCV